MRILSFTIILILASQFCFAQNNQRLDSLKSALTNTTNDTLRVLIYEKLTNNEPDYKKRVEFGLAGFALAKKVHFEKGIVQCGNTVGFLLAHAEHFKAIPILMEAKQVAEKTNDKIGLASSLVCLGYAYGKYDFEKSLDYYFRGKELMEKEKISEDIVPISLGIGMRYKDDNKNLDSALYYLNKSYQRSLNSKNYSYPSDHHFRHFGQVYYSKGQKDIALDYFRKAIAGSGGVNDFSYRYIALIFRDRNQLDSAKFYAQKSFDLEPEATQLLETATLLFELYQKSNPAKALEYHIIAAAAKDSIFNQGKIKQVDRLASEDQEREATIKRRIEAEQIKFQNRLRMNAVLGVTFTLFIVAIILFRNSRSKQKSKQKIESAFNHLKSTQAQLIQSEKMASLGELTAGIAHEIQNPLNFVNNFSEVNTELIKEIQDERRKTQNQRDEELEKELLHDIAQNQEKINHHGKRASDIVKGMLQHSRHSSGVKEPTDINALADEYLRLAYHGLRAKDKSFNATMKTDFDETIGNINIVPQDIGRVILNLITNAFYAVSEKQKAESAKPGASAYEPTVVVNTKKLANKVLISVKDNGNGIPQKILDKIFQPFFTTKPTGQGTGLGLSLSYDIVKAHGGELKVETKEGEGSEFVTALPL